VILISLVCVGIGCSSLQPASKSIDKNTAVLFILGPSRFALVRDGGWAREALHTLRIRI
jgi:hypothetical protein